MFPWWGQEEEEGQATVRLRRRDLRDRLVWRRRWTVAVIGKESGSKTSLDSIWRFRNQQQAIARAADLNRRYANDLVEYQAHRR